MITEIAERTALYRFFDQEGRLLYIGITRDPESRFAAHAREKALTWWPRVARRTVEWLETRRLAADAEVAAIAREQPIHNLSHNPAAMLTETQDAPLVGFTEIAKRLIDRGIVEKRITRQGVRHIAETDPEWPIPADQWLKIGNAWAMEWAPIEEFFRERDTKGRGPDLKPRKRPSEQPGAVEEPDNGEEAAK